MAAVILLAGVMAVIGAITAGQEQALEARRRAQAVLLAEEVMSQKLSEGYAAMSDESIVSGDFLAGVTVSTAYDLELGTAAVAVRGKWVRVEVTTAPPEARTLAALEQFVPEPPL